MERWLVRLGILLAMTALIMGARRGGCGGRGMSWQAIDGSFEPRLNLPNASTGTWTASMLDIPQIGAGSEWAGDDHSRLVVFSWDVIENQSPPLNAVRRPRSGAPPPGFVFGTAREIPWPRVGPAGASEAIPFPGSAANCGSVDSVDGCAASVRNVDIGFCSLPLPHVITEDTEISAAMQLLGLDEPGSGLAEQILAGFVDEFEEEFSDASISFGFPDLVTIQFTNAQPFSEDQPARFFPRFGAVDETGEGSDAAATNDEFCVDSAWHVRVTAWPLVAFPCPFDISVRFCGRFAARDDGEAAFEVTAVDTEAERRGRARCRLIERRTEQAVERTLEGSLPDALAEQLNERLLIRELPLPGGVVSRQSNCHQPNAFTAEERQASCEAAFPGLNGECMALDGEITESCFWRPSLSRVELMPSRTEFVLAEDPSDPLPAFLLGFGALAGPITNVLCRTADHEAPTTEVLTRVLSTGIVAP